MHLSSCAGCCSALLTSTPPHALQVQAAASSVTTMSSRSADQIPCAPNLAVQHPAAHLNADFVDSGAHVEAQRTDLAAGVALLGERPQRKRAKKVSVEAIRPGTKKCDIFPVRFEIRTIFWTVDKSGAGMVPVPVRYFQSNNILEESAATAHRRVPCPLVQPRYTAAFAAGNEACSAPLNVPEHEIASNWSLLNVLYMPSCYCDTNNDFRSLPTVPYRYPIDVRK